MYAYANIHTYIHTYKYIYKHKNKHIIKQTLNPQSFPPTIGASAHQVSCPCVASSLSLPPLPANTRMHMHTISHTPACICTQSVTHPHAYAHNQSHTRMHMHTISHTPACICTQSATHPHAYAHNQSHTRMHMHTIRVFE